MEKFEALQETEKQYFLEMVKQCKDSGANLIICQWCARTLSSLLFPHLAYPPPHLASALPQAAVAKHARMHVNVSTQLRNESSTCLRLRGA